MECPIALQDLGTQNDAAKNEHAALCELVQRSSLPREPTVLTADRGFASFNFFLHAERTGCHYVVRANDAYVRNLLGTASLPNVMDTRITRYLTRSRATGVRKHPDQPECYRVIPSQTTFDFLEPGAREELPVTLRIVRFQLKDGIFENIITDLSVEEFPQERLIRKYPHKLDIANALRTCHDFLRRPPGHENDLNIMELIERAHSPVRPDRMAPRRVRPHFPKSFQYRSS